MHTLVACSHFCVHRGITEKDESFKLTSTAQQEWDRFWSLLFRLFVEEWEIEPTLQHKMTLVPLRNANSFHHVIVKKNFTKQILFDARKWGHFKMAFERYNLLTYESGGYFNSLALRDK